MRMYNVHSILLTALLSSILLLGGGCTKKPIQVPDSDQTGPSFSSGTDIEYPAAQGSDQPTSSSEYSETSLYSEGTLDDTGSPEDNGAKGNLSVNQDGVEKTAEYKQEHGRSSPGLRPIYFGFDQATIRPDMEDRMANNAIFLQQNPGIKVVIEGNCDDRGTKEYNLALGQRRAINAKKYLINLGIEPHRIRTVSYGEEQPLFLGDDAFAWSQNRRDDFIVE